MKTYGHPRNKDLDAPDLADIRKYGLKSSKSRCIQLNGTRKNSFRNSIKKRKVRRYWKKVARRKGKKECLNNS